MIGKEVRYIINAKGQQTANLTAKDDGLGQEKAKAACNGRLGYAGWQATHLLQIKRN